MTSNIQVIDCMYDNGWQHAFICISLAVELCVNIVQFVNTPLQTTDIVNATLEGYPKSKKHLFVSILPTQLYHETEQCI